MKICLTSSHLEDECGFRSPAKMIMAELLKIGNIKIFKAFSEEAKPDNCLSNSPNTKEGSTGQKEQGNEIKSPPFRRKR